MPISTHTYQDYEFDIEMTPLDPSPYDPSTWEARVIRIVRVMPDGKRDCIDERIFRIVTGRHEDEALEQVKSAVHVWVRR